MKLCFISVFYCCFIPISVHRLVIYSLPSFDINLIMDGFTIKKIEFYPHHHGVIYRYIPKRPEIAHRILHFQVAWVYLGGHHIIDSYSNLNLIVL